MNSEAPFEAERKREIVLRGHAMISQSELIAELGPCGEPAADRVFQTDADGECPQRFIAPMSAVGWKIDLRGADAAPPVRTE